MSKQSGLGDNLLIGGYELSNDIGSLSRISGSHAVQDVTGIDKSAVERITLVRDGEISYSAYYNPSADRAHDRLSLLPTADAITTYLRGTALGGEAAALVGKQINYDGTRAADGSYLFQVQALANAYGLEWGTQLTAGLVAHTTDGDDGTGVDFAAGQSFGLQAYLQVTEFTGTNATISIQDSDDNGVDPWTNVASFTVVTGAHTSERIQTSRTEAIKRYVRVSSTGTFTTMTLQVMVNVNKTAVEF